MRQGWQKIETVDEAIELMLFDGSRLLSPAVDKSAAVGNWLTQTIPIDISLHDELIAAGYVESDGIHEQYKRQCYKLSQAGVDYGKSKGFNDLGLR